MPVPESELRAELAALLESDRSRVGEVYRLTNRGLSPPQIAQELGVNTSGFVSNYRSIARALLDGTLPGGARIADQAANSIRKLTRSSYLSDEARTYVDQLLEELAVVAAGAPKWTTRRDPETPSSSVTTPRPGTMSLRAQVESEIRARTRQLIGQIRDAVDVEPDDYAQILSAPSALDTLVRLCQVRATSRTTKALHEAGRLDLSIEAAVARWSDDLPLANEVVDSARGRLHYWSSE